MNNRKRKKLPRIEMGSLLSNSREEKIYKNAQYNEIQQ